MLELVLQLQKDSLAHECKYWRKTKYFKTRNLKHGEFLIIKYTLNQNDEPYRQYNFYAIPASLE